jgi:DnaK suppressor protein
VSEESLEPEEVSELEQVLRAAQAELERDLAASSDNSRPVDLGLSIGRLSRVDALQQQHMALARRERGVLQLQQVRAALSRIASGAYGECLGCGEPIGLARLRARPEAPFCKRCQSAGARG